MANALLILNAGSSSLKFAVFDDAAATSARILAGSIEQLGHAEAELRVKAGEAGPASAAAAHRLSPPDLATGIAQLLAALHRVAPAAKVIAVGHRIVHGGPHFTTPQRVTPELLAALRELSPFDPEHLPAEIALIHELQKHFPGVPQVACFDTAFHHDLPRVAQLLPLPHRYADAGVRRYGFHGLSYEFLLGELARLGEPAATQGRVILAHLGSGASLAAIRDGRCFDTSMGFTPTAGLVMGTRTGDLDPGLMAYLAQTEKMSAVQLNRLVNHESGLRGISGTSSDMRELLAREPTDPRAADAIAVFCYQAKKWIGAYAAALGGLDALVFSGGIGENCPAIRERICEDLGFLGIELDDARNAEAHPTRISLPAGQVVVRVIPTDEEQMIARHVRAVLAAAPPASLSS